MRFGNEWKEVQKHVGTRSSTQARSHAQKFFIKIKKANLLDVNIDFTSNSVQLLHDMANNLDSDKYFNAIKALNCIAFESKAENQNKKKRRNSNSENLQFLIKFRRLSIDSEIETFKAIVNKSNIKIIQNEPVFDDLSKKFNDYNLTNNLSFAKEYTLLNQISSPDYSLFTHSAPLLSKKRNRLSSFEQILGFNNNINYANNIYENWNASNTRRRTIDENDYINNFNSSFKKDTFNNEDDSILLKLGSNSEINGLSRTNANVNFTYFRAI